MARYTYDLVLNKPEDFVQFVMNDFLQKNRFEPADYNGEAVYRAGEGGCPDSIWNGRHADYGGQCGRVQLKDFPPGALAED